MGQLKNVRFLHSVCHTKCKSSVVSAFIARFGSQLPPAAFWVLCSLSGGCCHRSGQLSSERVLRSVVREDWGCRHHPGAVTCRTPGPWGGALTYCLLTSDGWGGRLLANS